MELEEEQVLEIKGLVNDNIQVNTDYNELKNKPSINNVTLMNNKTLDDLNIQKKGNYPETRLTNESLSELLE